MCHDYISGNIFNSPMPVDAYDMMLSDLALIGSGNGILSGRQSSQFLKLMLIDCNRALGTKSQEILNQCNSKKGQRSMTPAKWLPFCAGVNMMRWVKIKNHYGQLKLFITFFPGNLMFIIFLANVFSRVVCTEQIISQLTVNNTWFNSLSPLTTNPWVSIRKT